MALLPKAAALGFPCSGAEQQKENGMALLQQENGIKNTLLPKLYF
jgi:hypothetical protein